MSFIICDNCKGPVALEDGKYVCAACGKVFGDEKAEISKDLLQAPFVYADLKEPNGTQLNILHQVDCRPWEYTDSIGLDCRNGTPYFIYEVCMCRNASYYSQLFLTKIDYDTVRKYHPGSDYADLNENTWQNYISKSGAMLDHIGEPVTIESVPAEKPGADLQQFYFEYHTERQHEIVFLRKTSSGYRVFFVCPAVWKDSLQFEFDSSEEMIHDLLTTNKYGYEYDACDRLLSEAETAYLLSVADSESDNAESMNCEYIRCYLQLGTFRKHETNRKWQTFAYLCEKLAKYGSNYSLRNSSAEET